MRKDIPVVPPDSVIHTFSHLKPSNVYLFLTQDKDNVTPASFILRNTETVPVASGQPKDTWSQYFLDAWFDPLYRSYAFQKAENHALEHLIQWHPTLLAKLVIVEQRVMNSYSPKSMGAEAGSKDSTTENNSMWQAGDLVINFKDCPESHERDCMTEMKQHLGIQQETMAKATGKAGLG
jgi:mannan polymerase II complex MNN11 subunit